MIQIRLPSVFELQPFVEAAWYNDEELPRFYDRGLLNKCLDDMVLDTCSKIKQYINRTPGIVQLFGIEEKGAKIGFLVVDVRRRLLFSFGIAKQFRKPEPLAIFFKFICKLLSNEFSCILYSHNTRAINWLKKCGMKEIKTDFVQLDMVYLKYH